MPPLCVLEQFLVSMDEKPLPRFTFVCLSQNFPSVPFYIYTPQRGANQAQTTAHG
jgi:hypothetical protein